MECPQDHTSLREANYEAEIRVDQCPKCGGIWLDSGELEAIQTTHEKQYADELVKMADLGGEAFSLALAKQAPEVACPKCEKLLDRREYGYCSQILIDHCPSCGGIWLDKGELQALEIFFERSRLESRDLRKAFFAGLKAMLE